jgi:hypothetical protein
VVDSGRKRSGSCPVISMASSSSLGSVLWSIFCLGPLLGCVTGNTCKHKESYRVACDLAHSLWYDVHIRL